MHPDSVLNLPDQPRMLDVVRQGLDGAAEVCIAVSFTRFSGLGLLVDPLREVVESGGAVRLLTSTYQCVTQPEALAALLRIPGIQTRVQDGALGFHAKFWWFHKAGGAELWAGSSNLSKGGLATNLEWNLRSVDPGLVAATRRQFDLLWGREDVHVPDDAFVNHYRERYKARSAQPGPWGPTGASGSPVSVSPPLVSTPWRPAPAPNAAQQEALLALSELRARGERRAAVIAATGVGKTYLAAFDVLHSGARRVLYVSHRLEHLHQARRTFAAVMPSRRFGLIGGGEEEVDADILFVTVASFTRRPDLAARAFEYLIIDEFHHAEAPSYESLRPVREQAFLLGLTATPERQDGHDVLAWCDWNVAYEVRLPEAIDRGWLLPFHYFGIADETVDFLRIPWRRLDEVEDALSVEARAEHVLHHALERGYDGAKRATLGFCAGRRHACFMAEAFNRRGQTAAVVLGDAPVANREELYRRLADEADPLEWLFVSDVLNEGVDIPVVNSVLFLRPTESATLFLQQLGRGLRLYPGTEVLTVLDFVGHHRSAWLTLNTLDAPGGGGRRTAIAEGVTIKPPRACEVVLQRRTREILAKVARFTSKREACAEAYRRLRDELGRPLLPVDLWGREDVPDLSAFRGQYRSWLRCQRANGDTPAWAEAGVPLDVEQFLSTVESDWQALRVAPYALVWGLCTQPEDPGAGYEAFFDRWPQWKVERSPLAGAKTWGTVQRKLGFALDGERLRPEIRRALGDALCAEVEGRLLYTTNTAFQERHGGVLRRPEDLNLHARYRRPELIRHFGVPFDPARHHDGMVWIGDHGVIVTKLDTSGARVAHQYQNRLIDPWTFRWTSQNRMAEQNEAGRKVLECRERGLTLHLFVQRRAHESAYYLGTAAEIAGRGAGPMRITLTLATPVPGELFAELTAGGEGGSASAQ